MRKLLLITAIVLLTTSALAGPRGLSAPPPAEPTPAQAQTTTQAQPVQKPARKRVARQYESNERKARRIAARFGIYW